MPAHVAIIMDGNGRWAATRGLPRVEGHRRGIEAIRRAVRAAGDLGIRYLTVYSFSSENWRRPAQEVADLMGLLKRFVRHDLADLHANNVRVRIIGDRESLQPDIRALLQESEDLTRRNTGLTLVVAFNYGRPAGDRPRGPRARRAGRGRDAPARRHRHGLAWRPPSTHQRHPGPGPRDPTSGEQRISNFLTWQTAYSEFVFIPDFWPDFDHATLTAAIDEYRRRDRRFGGLSARAG
jgi:undecaprenyl diphosphate synthase